MTASANGYSYWRPDSSTLDCEDCLQPFTMFNRRHHCRDCGGVFCSKCTATKVAMPHRRHAKPERICRLCAKYVTIKLAQARKEQGGEKEDLDDMPLFVAGGGGTAAQRDVFDHQEVEAQSRYNKIASEFRDAMIKRTETEKELSNYSMFGGDSSIFSPKRNAVKTYLTQSSSCARSGGIGQGVTGNVITLLNVNPPGNNGAPASPSPNTTFTSGLLQQSLARNGTRNNTHPSFLRVREALNNAHKVTLDSGAPTAGFDVDTFLAAQSTPQPPIQNSYSPKQSVMSA